MNVIMKIRKSDFEDVMKELKDIIVENDIMIKIEEDEEFDKNIELEKHND